MIELEGTDSVVHVTGGQVLHHDLDCSEGEFLHLLVEQRGIDVALRLIGPDGVERAAVDSPTGSHGSEELIWVTVTAGRHRLLVEAPAGATAGEVVLRTLARRPAQAEDRALVAADLDYREGRRLLKGGFPEQAIEPLRKALDEFRERSWINRQAESTDTLGRALHRAGNPQAALDHTESALDLYRRCGLGAMEPYLLDRMGRLQLQLGRPWLALSLLQEAVHAFEEIEELARAAATQVAVGQAYHTLGDLGAAIGSFDRALEFSDRVGAESARASALMGRGASRLAERRNAEAAADYREALAIFERLAEVAGRAAALVGLAEAGDGPSADKAILEAIELLQGDEHRQSRAAALNSLGNLRRRGGDVEGARAAYSDARSTAREAGDRRTEATALLGLGFLGVRSGEPREGLERLEAALALFVEIGDSRGERSARARGAEALRDLGRLGEAWDLLEPAIDGLGLLDPTLGAPLNEAADATAHDPQSPVHPDHLAIAVDLLARQHLRERSARDEADRDRLPGPHWRAYALNERRLVRVEAERRRETEPRDGQDPARTSTEGAFRRPADLAAIRRSLGADAVLLAFALGEERSWLWVVTLETLELFALHSRSEIERLVEIVADQAAADGPSKLGGSREAALLSRLLFSPLLENPIHGRLRRWIVTAEEPLRSVPLGALPDGSAGSPEALDASRAIEVHPSASAFVALQTSRADLGPPVASEAAFGRSYDSLEPPEEPDQPNNPAHSDLPGGDDGETMDPETEAALEQALAADRERRRREEFGGAVTLSEPVTSPSAQAATAADSDLEEDADLAPNEVGRWLVDAWRAESDDEVQPELRLSLEYEEEWAAQAERKKRRRELPDSVDPHDLAATGWGVVFPAYGDRRALDFLDPLLRHRESQAGHRFRTLSVYPGESVETFLWDRYGENPGVLGPDGLPYYLLIVGDPDTISFDFQYGLSINHAVGRISFDELEHYGRYAQAVVEAEEYGTDLPHRATIFSVDDGDRATGVLAENLVAPIHDLLDGWNGWEVDVWNGERSDCDHLGRLLGGPATPGLLLAACHGRRVTPGHPDQRKAQGALQCRAREGQDRYFGAERIDGASRLEGLIAFLFACYGAGTPLTDSFPHELRGGTSRTIEVRPKPLAARPFCARLPQALLARGALAVVGHVDRGWTTSFRWDSKQRRTQAVNSLQDTLQQLLAGHRLGHSLRPMVRRATAIASLLTKSFDRVRQGEPVDMERLGYQWTAHHDARNFVVLGDPAVYLRGQRNGEARLGPGERRRPAELDPALLSLVAERAQASGMSVNDWLRKALAEDEL